MTAIAVLVLSLAAAPGGTAPRTLAPLPYAYDALEPHIDRLTVEIHHDRHHQAYLDGLNKALAGSTAYAETPAEDLVRDLDSLPADLQVPVRKFAGGVANHDMFWLCMAPGAGGEPGGAVGRAIRSSFGSFGEFREKFTAAAMGVFGSGWAWLVDDHGKLAIVTTANQDSPLSAGMTPLLVIDAWEHAYYLKYRNRRADFVAGWWNLVNWKEVDRRMRAARRR